MAYRVEIKKSAKNEIAGLPRREQRRVMSAIGALADVPRPRGGRKLTGTDDIYRLRVGDYRVVYQIGDKKLIVYVVKVGDRKEVYRRRA